MDRVKGYGVCKDCGNGTLDNVINQQFDAIFDFESGDEVICCSECGSTHIDGQFFEESI
jgi:hypothetical protein